MPAPRTTTDLQGNTRVLLDPAAIAAITRGPGGPGFRETLIIAEKVKVAAIALAPKKTGNLANHIVKRIVAGPTALVGVENVPYAIFVHEGARPHLIRPVKAAALVFYWPKAGKVVSFPPYGKGVVHHPGNKPNRFLVKALATVKISQFTSIIV